MAELVDAIGILLQGMVSLFIIDVISDIKWNKKNWLVKVICLGFILSFWLLIRNSKNGGYIIGIMLDTMGYCVYSIVLKRQKFITMFSSVMAVNIINAFCGFTVAVIFSGMFYKLPPESVYYPGYIDGRVFASPIAVKLYLSYK